MNLRRVRAALGLSGLLLLLSACSSLPVATDRPPATDDPVATCRDWYARLDQQITRYGVNDAQAHRVADFPQLRVSRLAASFRGQAAQGGAAFQDWLDLLQTQGSQAHAIEIGNLPAPGLDALLGESPAPDPRTETLARTRHCARTLSEADHRADPRRARLLESATVPDAYSAAARWLGLYALTRWPFAAGVQRWQQETTAAFNRVEDGVAPPRRYVPPARASGEEVAETGATVRRNALGLPLLDEPLQQRWLDRHAPVFELRAEGPFDHIGAIALASDAAPRVDTTQPTVYRRVAFVRQGEQTLVQLVYLAWFSERPSTGAFDLLAGPLDGLIWRVTLDEAGRPLLYDSIHACGCYHLFFPSTRLRARPAPEAGIEWVFTPGPAPELQAGERMVLRLAPRTHYLTGLAATRETDGERYRNEPEDRLRSLPLADGRDRRSLYGPDGIVPGTQRGERWLFWPMGVRDAGAQRQWGHHATAFVGRRHFDDPDLIERRFERIDAPAFARSRNRKATPGSGLLVGP